MVDEYLKNKLDIVNSKYIVIDMKDLKIDIIKEKAELNKNIAPLDKIDTCIAENREDIGLIINDIIKNYKN